MRKQGNEGIPTAAQWWGEVGVFSLTTVGVAVLAAVVLGAADGRPPVVDLGVLLPAGVVGLWAARSYRRTCLANRRAASGD
ncbi:hypothetical protein DSC45_03735 [Streptomyces sp. YIM 130001]|uniref:hypothetical protein n=1 Tax=Streptomyces sp. YIM 130001 TaxID=2259644 RepID=UPI000E6508A6|nr:hypothetical protein [Streptomyces sp. YIM 130001]RII20313.1 hypothetical protein DSC45_03735 [Streptomyces sp. YIM 130001]